MPKTPPTNVLIIGSGGREHAIGWKLKQSKRCGKLYFAPGNGGTAALGTNVPDLPCDPVNTKNADAIDYFCRQNKVGLIVIGPEDPLAGGLADRLQKEGRYVFGPVAAAARLEADKAYAKQLMRACRVPTGEARTFTNADQALEYVRSRTDAIVVKAAGLAKGKGVTVCKNKQEALAAVREIMIDKAFGEAGDTVVIEEKLTGQELSVLALVDGRNIYVLDPSQDHKQAGEGDTGPNTGGMGVYCPTPLADDKLMQQVMAEVLVPIVDVMRRDGIDYKGVLYAGLMLTPAGPKVLEFNCRFGDPETQSLLVRMKGDLLDAMIKTCQGKLDEANIEWDSKVCLGVVIASGGYPGDYEKNKTITGIDDAEQDPDVTVFHAGTKQLKDGGIVTNGGRVLNVCAIADTLKEAQTKANDAADKIKFDGAWFRRDIGFRVMD